MQTFILEKIEDWGDQNKIENRVNKMLGEGWKVVNVTMSSNHLEGYKQHYEYIAITLEKESDKQTIKSPCIQ